MVSGNSMLAPSGIAVSGNGHLVIWKMHAMRI
jgi:hypothetical protein